jgi:CubicO group peptidase (beta-lactamase class C family)
MPEHYKSAKVHTIKDIDNHKKVFEIGSITKVLNSSILSKLILQGKVKPDENITDIIPLKLKGNPKITIEQLANHTAGLERNPPDIKSDYPNKSYPDNLYSDDKLLNYLSNNLKLQCEPGAKMSYSNTGGQLLGYILCKIENTDFETLLQQNIFSRFKMTSSTTNKNNIQSLLVTGLDKDGNVCSHWHWKTYLYAGNGTFSNAEDLSKFAIAECDTNNYDLQFAQKKTFHIADSVFQNSTADIGLDWIILNRKSGEKWIWHNGATDGYYSHIIINTQKRKAVVMLSNISSTNTQRRTTQVMIESLLESL